MEHVLHVVEVFDHVEQSLHPGGVFAMWCDDPPEEEFLNALDLAFGSSRAHIVPFHNPLLDCDAASTVYVARTAGAPRALARHKKRDCEAS